MAVFSTDLFDLIKSMSPQEKAYFKRYGYKSGTRLKEYLQLFDAIEKQKTYNESVLRKKFKKEDGFNSISAAKNHLYHQVLRSLVDYNADKSSEDQILRHLQEVFFLQSRGLNEQCNKRIKSTWKIIIDSDLDAFAPILFPIETSLIPYTEEAYTDRFKVLEREKENINALDNLSRYRYLYARMTQVVTKWGVIVRDPRHIQEVETMLADPLLQNDESAILFEAKSMLYSTNKILNQVICRYDEALIHSRKAVQLHEQCPGKLGKHQRSYLMALFNLLNDLVGAAKFEEFEEWKVKIELYLSEMPDSPFKVESEANLTCRVVYKEMLTRNYLASLRATVQLKRGLHHFDFQPHLNIQHRYLIACANFYCGEILEAQKWVAGLLVDDNLESFSDYLNFTLILNLSYILN